MSLMDLVRDEPLTRRCVITRHICLSNMEMGLIANVVSDVYTSEELKHFERCKRLHEQFDTKR